MDSSCHEVTSGRRRRVASSEKKDGGVSCGKVQLSAQFQVPPDPMFDRTFFGGQPFHPKISDLTDLVPPFLRPAIWVFD